MTVVTIKSGRGLNEPRSLVEQLQASVDYNAETTRQRAAMRIKRESGPLPSDATLEAIHADLNLLVGITRWVLP